MADVQRWTCTEQDYFASPRLSRSRLEVFLESPRTVGILSTQGSPLLGNLRLARAADGRPVRFGPNGAVAPAVAAGLEALAAEGQR